MRVTETLLIDTRRRLVIVRVDDREHVMLLGPAGDVLVTDMAAKETVVVETPVGETTT
jgi:flagellar protein FliO/FliZ